MRRFALLIAAAGAAASISAFALVGGASGASSPLPTLNIALTGATGVSVSGNPVQGAVNVVSTFSGKVPSGPMANGPSFALVRLNPDESDTTAIANGFAAVQKAHGNLDALTATGNELLVSATPGTLQTTLTAGKWLALNTASNGKPAFAEFTVGASSAPAALPAAPAQTAIEFGFKGPTVLHAGSMVRAQNGGFLVHMIDLIGAKSKRAAKLLVAGLKAGKSKKALRPLLNNQFVSLLNPASPGALQQFVLNAKPGWYAEACFMDTQDGREHVVLGMERMVHVVK